MRSFLLAVEGNRKMSDLFTQFEPIWVQTSNTETLDGHLEQKGKGIHLVQNIKEEKRAFTLQWVQQMANSGAVISHSFMVNCALPVTFQGTEHKLHGIYLYLLCFSCSVTPNGMMILYSWERIQQWQEQLYLLPMWLLKDTQHLSVAYWRIYMKAIKLDSFTLSGLQWCKQYGVLGLNNYWAWVFKCL